MRRIMKLQSCERVGQVARDLTLSGYVAWDRGDMFHRVKELLVNYCKEMEHL